MFFSKGDRGNTRSRFKTPLLTKKLSGKARQANQKQPPSTPTLPGEEPAKKQIKKSRQAQVEETKKEIAIAQKKIPKSVENLKNEEKELAENITLDNTLKLNETDLSKDLDYPNTGFGAGDGPGTAERPRLLNCGPIECAYASDVGRLRSNNEDCAVAFLGMVERVNAPFGFFAIADGMGGHENGEVASNIAVRRMLDAVIREFYLPSKEGLPIGIAGETPVDILFSLINDANQAIVNESVIHYHNSMGTTLSCIILYGGAAIIGHVGDSRIYLINQVSGEMQLATHDHSLVQRLVDAGQLTPGEALNHPQRSYLYMSLGQKGVINPYTSVVPLVEVSYILICSDGLWDMLEDSIIQSILLNSPTPAEACRNLINAANEAGGADNITVVVIKL